MKEVNFKLYDDKKDEEVKIFNPEDYAEELVFDKVDDAVTNEVMEAEQDIPIPPNFVEFCKGRKFLDTTILPRQIQIGSEFFGEICHFCSNPDATHNLFDQKMDYIYDNIVFLRHGKCPKCGRTKIDMIKEGKWNFKNALFVVAGQRCVTGDTIVYTKEGPVQIKSFDRPYYIEGAFNQVTGYVYSDEGLEQFVAFYKSKPETIIKITTSRGYYIKGTAEHPVMMADKQFKKLGDIKVNDSILVYSSWVTKISDRDWITKIEVLPEKEVTYDFHIPKTHKFLANNMLSSNSGKSIVTALIAHYQNVRFLTMRDKKKRRVIPYQYFKNPPAPLYGTFTAVTYDQVIKNLWEPFKGYIDTPWYKEYHELLDYFSKKNGIELYKSSQTFLQYNHKRIAWLPETPSKKGLRGKTRIFFSIDELSWYDLNNNEDSKKGSAKEIMAAGRNSLLTVRRKSLEKLKKNNYNIPTGMECYVSSPAEANDILMRKVRESRKDPTMLGYRYATWEFNPDYHSPEDIGETDQMILMRDFGANPPLGNSQFYSDSKTLVENVDKNRKPIATFIPQVSRNSFGDTTLYPKLDAVLSSSTYPKLLSIDNGLSGNCFAASLCHLEGKKVCNDFLVCIQPDEKHKINLSKCFDEFVVGLMKDKRFNIAMIAYDRWNSEQAIMSLRDEGINAVKYSITYSDFLQIRDSFAIKAFGFINPVTDVNRLVDYEGDFDFLDASYRDPYFGLLYQILTVKDCGRYLAKPGNGMDDDIFRAWALGAILLFDEDYKDIFSGEGKVNKQSNRALGSMSSFSHRVSANTASSSNVFGKLRAHKF